MRLVPLLPLLLLSGVSAHSQQAGKKPKPAIAQAIDSASLGGPKASALAEDGEFLRRLMLDLVGYPPNLEQVKAFMADPNPNKRSDKIDELLETEDWADRTARLFSAGWFDNYHDIPIMLTPMVDAGVKSRLTEDFLKWLKGKLQKDAPYNTEIVDAILRARGTGTGDPALLWKLSCFAGDDAGPVEFANRVSKHFMGIRLKCAQCHDHPFDVWNEGHFYKLAAFFGRTRAKGGNDAELSEGGPDDDKMMMRAQGTNQQPQFIFGQRPGKNDPWMDALAVYMTGQNPQLPLATANRVWSWLFGRGLVHPVDDFNRMKAPLGGGLLGRIAGEFKSSKYSIKTLYRGICNSDAYQRASANPGDMTKPSFAAAWIKHLDPEQLLNSVQVATTGRPGKSVSEAMSKVAPLFPADVVWCEVTPLPGNMRQALLLRNNSSIHSAISGGGVLRGLSGATTADKVKEMFLAALSRVPTEAETARFVKYIDGHAGEGLEDAYWALLNTTEFLTRH